MFDLKLTKEEFPEHFSGEYCEPYQLPKEIDALLENGTLLESSWHNDAYPSFCLASNEQVILFVAHQDKSFREFKESPRFFLHRIDDDEECFDAIETDDVSEIVRAIHEIDGKAPVKCRYCGKVNPDYNCDCKLGGK